MNFKIALFAFLSLALVVSSNQTRTANKMPKRMAFQLLEDLQRFLYVKVKVNPKPNAVRMLALVSSRLRETALLACQQCFPNGVSEFLQCAHFAHWKKRYNYLVSNNCL